MALAGKNKIMAYIGLGSNLDQPVHQLKAARQAIVNLKGVQECAFSSFYRSPPMGPAEQPDYINAVMAVSTILDATELLHRLQQVERQQGRIRTGERWGPRTLDLDLLLYGDRRINRAELIVPHYGIAERAFVLYPLFEIAPDLDIPGIGPVAELVAKCPLHGLTKLKPT